VFLITELEIDDVQTFSQNLELLNSYMEQEMMTWQQQEQNRNRPNHPHQLNSNYSTSRCI